MKHEGRWQLDQLEPGRFRWRSPLGQMYWARGDPIAPDLPEPVPRADSDCGDCGTDGSDTDGSDTDGSDNGCSDNGCGDNGCAAGQMVGGPIFAPRQAARPEPRPPELPPPRPRVDADDLPPF